MNIKCQQSIKTCACEDSVVQNLSSEAPDQDRFLAPSYFVIPQNRVSRRVNHNFNFFGQEGCSSWCWSAVSQDDAADCVARQAIECQEPVLDPPLAVFGNTAQSCESVCPNGTVSTVIIPAGTVLGLSQADANVIALSIACFRADQQAHCVTHTPPGSGPAVFYNVETQSECLPGSTGVPIIIPAGVYSSTISQYDADSYAVEAAAEYAIVNCYYHNVAQTAQCPGGTTGPDVTVPANSYVSNVSQEAADDLAMQAALNLLNCAGGDVPQCSESNGALGAPLVWSLSLPSSEPPCGDMPIHNGTGTWHMLYAFGSCEKNYLKSKATICNGQGPYPFTATFTGAFTTPQLNQSGAIRFNLLVDGVLAESVLKDTVNGAFTDAVLHGIVPGFKFSVIEVQVEYTLASLSPQEANGTVAFSPLTHP